MSDWIQLELLEADIHTIVAALSYVNHPTFAAVRKEILDQAHAEGMVNL